MRHGYVQLEALSVHAKRRCKRKDKKFVVAVLRIEVTPLFHERTRMYPSSKCAKDVAGSAKDTSREKTRTNLLASYLPLKVHDLCEKVNRKKDANDTLQQNHFIVNPGIVKYMSILKTNCSSHHKSMPPI